MTAIPVAELQVQMHEKSVHSTSLQLRLL